MAEQKVRTSDGGFAVTTEPTGEGAVYRTEPRPVVAEQTVVDRSMGRQPARDSSRWGPILAGLVSAIASLLVLTVLGLALGLSAFDPSSSGASIGRAAGLWSGVMAVISFFIGGWVAGFTAGLYRPSMSWLNGFIVGAAALSLILWLASMGLGNALGIVGSNLGQISNVGVPSAQQAQSALQDAYNNVQDAAWWTLGGLILALAASTLGGYIGYLSRPHRDMEDAKI